MLAWTYKETTDSEIAKFTVGTLSARVQDCDGDFSVWSICDEKNGMILAQGKQNGYEPYHFDVAKELCERTLQIIAKSRNLYTGE